MVVSNLFKYNIIKNKVIKEFFIDKEKVEASIKNFIESLAKEKFFSIKIIQANKPRKYDITKIKNEGHTYLVDFYENYDNISSKVMQTLNDVLSDLISDMMIANNIKINPYAYYHLNFNLILNEYILVEIKETNFEKSYK